MIVLGMTREDRKEIDFDDSGPAGTVSRVVTGDHR